VAWRLLPAELIPFAIIVETGVSPQPDSSAQGRRRGAIDRRREAP
jgi:hypothetical protein